MRFTYVLPILLGVALGNSTARCQPGLARKFSTFERKYANYTTTTTTTITTTTSDSSTQGPSYASSLPSSSQPTCLTNSTATYYGTRVLTATSIIDETTSVTANGKSYYAAGTSVITITRPPPCHTVTPTTTRGASTVSGGNTAETLTYYSPSAPTPSPTQGGTTTTLAGTTEIPSTSVTVTSDFGYYTTTQVITRKTIVNVPPEPTKPPFSFGNPPDTPYSNNDHNSHGGDGGSGKPNGNNGGPNPGDSAGGPGPPITPPAHPVPGTQVIGGETVIYGPTAVIIGGSTITIPTTEPQSPPKVTLNGKTFTVLPSQIIGPGTTFNMPLATAAVSTITQPPSTVVVDGITVTVGPSQAIISGTNYRIGIPSDPQTIVVDGHTITLNSRGVIFPSTTLSPALTIGISGDDLYRIVVYDGVTVSIEGTDAIISGSTFKIGTGAGSASTITVGGKVITAGPDGLILGGATIDPTSLDRTATMTATEGAGPTNPAPTPTGDGGTQSSTSDKNSGTSFQSLRSSLATMLPVLISAYFFINQF